ncbi:hypothetical protein [Bradyrhizobium canariense]|uniref:hypothetical protein n=1 Tax=Bradyrhizobium canariense TaxID=255045 RepID=UPI0011BAC218|nr:hypothetical protein [Bradyrhizobium canariense]
MDDYDVRFITDAAIEEISIVNFGKCPYSYARMIDASVEKSLKESSDRGLILLDGASRELTRTLDRITKNANRLVKLAKELAGQLCVAIPAGHGNGQPAGICGNHRTA